GIGAADHLPDVLDDLLRAEDFGRMEAAVDENDGLAFLRERPRLIVGEPFRVRELARDLAVAIQLLHVLGRRHDRVHVSTLFGRLPDVADLQTVRLLLDLVEVVDELGIRGELVVVADVETEERFRRSDGGRGLCRGNGRGLRNDNDDERGNERQRAHTAYVHGASIGGPYTIKLPWYRSADRRRPGLWHRTRERAGVDVNRAVRVCAVEVRIADRIERIGVRRVSRSRAAGRNAIAARGRAGERRRR